MKKLIITVILTSIVLFSMSQIKPINGGSIIQGGEAGDTLTASATLNYDVFTVGDAKYDYIVQVATDSVSGTPAYTMYLQGSNNYEDWANIDTVSHATGNDTAFVVTQTGNLYRYLRVNFTGTATAQKSNVEIFWNFLK